MVRLFASERFSISLSRSSCLNYLHRLGFAFKRPKKRLLKADAEKREAFVEEYAALAFQSQESGEKIFFADEAHFRADAELRGKWVLRGEPALVDSTSPRYGEKASYYSAVCLETGQVEWMELEGNSNSGTSAAFLEQLRRLRSERNGNRYVRYARRLVNLPGYSPDFNADEAIWAGRERRPPEICAWGPRNWFRRGSGTSSMGWPGGKRRSSAAAGPSCNQEQRGSRVTLVPIPTTGHMYIPPWL